MIIITKSFKEYESKILELIYENGYSCVYDGMITSELKHPNGNKVIVRLEE